MKDFHRSFICRSTETGKKVHKNKHHSNKNDVCKCYAPFLKLHYYDCPVARKPCPIHGNPYRTCFKDEKAEKKENMIISFHPSWKTDRLFKPVKNLLAHCSSETRINLEYYSPNDSRSKGNVKHRQVQTSPGAVKKNSGNNVFVEKTKSFVSDKTNRMKRLKQCFHSPCNSIVARTSSQITLKNKMNDRDGKSVQVAMNIPEGPYFDEKSKWASSNKLDSSDWEKSSNDKLESDFLTVTKKTENKVIDHKIFEIKHKKGFGDFGFTKLPKESPIVYSSYDIKKSKSAFDLDKEPYSDQKNLERYSNKREFLEKSVKKEEEMGSSDKSQSGSSGSVYFTPFILIPPGMEESSDESRYSDDMPKEKLGNVKKEKKAKLVDAFSQTENPGAKTIYEATSTSENSSLSKSSDFFKEPESLKKEKNLGPENKSESLKYIFTPEKYPKITRNENLAAEGIADKSTQFTPPNSRLPNDFNLLRDAGNQTKGKDSKLEKPQSFGDEEFISIQIQTDSVQKREVALVYDGIKNVADKITQTVPVITRNVQVETMAQKKNKSQMTFSTTAKSVQTSFTLSDSTSQSNEGDFKDLDGNVNFVVSYLNPTSSQDVSKSRWKKSRSDGDLYSGATDNSGSENVIPLRHTCLCGNSDTSTSESELIGSEKNSKSHKSDMEKRRTKPMIQNEQCQTIMKKEVISKGEQTSLSDLTELVRIVDQFFDKMSKEAFKGCECEKIKERELKTNQGVNNDTLKLVKKPKTRDIEVQTMSETVANVSEEDKVKENSNQVKVRRSGPPQNNNGETVFICKICRKKVSTVVAATCTTLDNIDKVPSSKKEASTSTDGLEKSVLYRSIGVCVSDYGMVDSYVPVQTKSLNDIKSTCTCDSASQKPEWTINITTKKCSTFLESCLSKEECKADPNKSQMKKETATTSQGNEKRSIKKPTETWKSVDYSLLSDSYSTSKPSDLPKQRPVPGRVKSNIPTAANNYRKSINFKEKETTGTKMCTQVPITQCVNKEILKPEKNSCAPVIEFNRNTVCFCESPKPSSKIEPSTSNKSARFTDQKPPLPTKQQPGMSNAKPKTNPPQTSSQTTPKKPGQKKTFLYPAIIRPIWHTDFFRAWHMMKSFQGHDSNERVLKQKRCCEKEEDSPGGKKIKRKDNGSGENSELEKNVFTASRQKTINIRNDSGFVWTPPSSLQVSKVESRPVCFYKGSQSESKVSKTGSQNLSTFKGFSKRTSANVVSVTSCRLKPVQVNEKHPFRKLFECRLCKSLNFLKNDQKDILQNKQPSDGAFGFESLNGKHKSPISDGENSGWAYSPRSQDNFLVEYSFSSDPSDSTDLSDSSDLLIDNRDGITERVDMNFSNCPGPRTGSLSNMAYASRSFQTFWFGGEKKK